MMRTEPDPPGSGLARETDMKRKVATKQKVEQPVVEANNVHHLTIPGPGMTHEDWITVCMALRAYANMTKPGGMLQRLHQRLYMNFSIQVPDEYRAKVIDEAVKAEKRMQRAPALLQRIEAKLKVS